MLAAAALLMVALAQEAPGEPQGRTSAEGAETTEAAPEQKPPTPRHTGVRALLDDLKDDVKNLPSIENVYIAGMGGALAAAVHPLDPSVNGRLISPHDAVNDIFAAGNYYGGTPAQLGLSIGTYIFGRVMDEPKVSHLGMDLLRAQAIAELMVEPLKFATHRERPDGSNHQSFPSGHAAATFAGAAVIERHLGLKKSILAFAIASYVATSRLHDNQHYLSDVVFGAAIGEIAGRTVTRHGRENWTFGPTPVPKGIAILATRNGT
jgi:membrane-associated phospholipid phosphatase